MPKKSKFKFVKEKNRIYFQDEWGVLWSADQLGGLFRALKKHREANDELECYCVAACGEKDFAEEMEEAIAKEKQEMEKRQQNAIKKHLCKKCGGVIVKSMGTAYLAHSHGKTCGCKK